MWEQFTGMFQAIWQSFFGDESTLIELMDWFARGIYNLFGCDFFLRMLDLCQKIFYAFAGVGGSVTIGGTTIKPDINFEGLTGNGIEYYLLTSDMVRNIRYSMLILACVLLLLFTIIAFLKNIYTDKPKSWQTIIGDAIKGIGMFMFVPAVCLFGVYLGNGLLRAVHQFSSARGVDTLNYKYLVLRTAYYDANKFRIKSNKLNSFLEEVGVDDEGKTVYQVKDEAAENLFEYAKAVLIPKNIYNDSDNNSDDINNGIFMIDKDTIVKHDHKDTEYFADLLDRIQSYNPDKVEKSFKGIQFYDIDTNFSVIEFFIIVGGLIFSVGGLAMGMIKRLFMILVLFIISPIVCALYPLQGNNPVKTWTGDFVKNVTSAYSGVFGLNLMYILMPYITNIDFGLKQGYANLVSIFIVIAATSVVKDIINLISTYIGVGNAYGEGNGMFNDSYNRVKGGLAKTGQVAATVGSGVGGIVGGGIDFASAAINFKSHAPSAGIENIKRGVKSVAGIIPTSLKLNTMQGVAGFGLENVMTNAVAGYKNSTGESIDDTVLKALGNKEKDEIEKKKNEAKDAAKEVGKLTDTNNSTLNKLAKSRPEDMTEEEYKADLVDRAKKGSKWEMEDFAKVDKNTPEGRKQYTRMLEENKYISTVSSAVEKQNEAQKFLDDVKSYKEAGYGPTEALALKAYREGKQPAYKVEEKPVTERGAVYDAKETSTTAKVPTGEKPIVVTPGATEERPYKRKQPESDITADNVKLTVSSADFNAQNSQQTLYTVQQQTQNSTVKAQQLEDKTNLLNQQNDDKNAQLIINAVKQMTEYEKKMNDYLAQLTQKLDELNGTMVDGLKNNNSTGGDGSDSSTGGSGNGGSPTRFNGGNKGNK